MFAQETDAPLRMKTVVFTIGNGVLGSTGERRTRRSRRWAICSAGVIQVKHTASPPTRRSLLGVAMEQVALRRTDGPQPAAWLALAIFRAATSFWSEAYDASADGSIIVGRGSSETGDQAFRWTEQDGLIGLGDLPGGTSWSMGTAVSADGSVVTGISSGDIGSQVFRWTSGDGMVSLGHGEAKGISADGSVIVGMSSFGNGQEAFRWTDGSGMVGLGRLPGTLSSRADAISGDGSKVVGISHTANGGEAFQWTATTGMVGLGELAGGSFLSIAHGASADGSVIVGMSSSGFGLSGLEAFYWTEELGMINLREFLIANGATNLDGWTLLEATAISADGLTIVGGGRGPDRTNQAWIATIPEPTAFGLLLLGIACLTTLPQLDRGLLPLNALVDGHFDSAGGLSFPFTIRTFVER